MKRNYAKKNEIAKFLFENLKIFIAAAPKSIEISQSVCTKMRSFAYLTDFSKILFPKFR